MSQYTILANCGYEFNMVAKALSSLVFAKPHLSSVRVPPTKQPHHSGELTVLVLPRRTRRSLPDITSLHIMLALE
jgi:hypothetical protein